MSSNIYAQDDAVYTEDMHLRAEKDVGYGAQESFLIWHGYLNWEFDAEQGTNSNFDLHEFYLSAKSEISDVLSITAEFEYEHAPEKLILPIQAYADWKLADEFIVRAGIYFTPMGIPRTYNLRGNKNRMIKQVGLTHDIMYENWSEMGMNFLGQFKNGLFYDVSISNGMPYTIAPGDSFFDAIQDLQNHTEDNNDNKAISARFGYHSRSFANGELNFGISLGRQKYDPTNTLEMNHNGFDLRYLHRSGWRFQGEYMRKSGGQHETEYVPGVLSIDALGWYAQVSKRWVGDGSKKFFNYIEPVFMVDLIDLDVDVDNNNNELTYSPGLVYSPIKYYLLKFQYEFTTEQFGPSVDNNMFWASIVAEF